MNGDYNNQPYDYASHSTNPPHDDYGALLNDHYNQSNNNPSQESAKKFLFSVEDFLDTVRKLKDDYDSNNGTLHDIGAEPTDLFNDLKYHLNKQNRIASDSLNRLLDGVKMLKKLKSRCANAFTSWKSVENLIQTVDDTTKAHPDFNGIIAQREQEAKQRLQFLRDQKMQKQPYYGRGNNRGGHSNYYPNTHTRPGPNRDYNYNYGPRPSYSHGGYRPPHHSGRAGQERRTVYVYGFPRKWGPTELRYLFDCIGETEDVDVLKRKGDTAFIHYIYPADARECVEQMNNSCPLYCKRPISVEMADKSRLGVGMSKSHICWLYNQRTCQMGMTCNRQHVCLFCNGGHPRKQCTEVDKHFRKLRADKSEWHSGGGSAPFRCSDFEITIDDIPINAANERDLRLLFNSAGPITRIKIMKPRKRNMKVRAYMEFADQISVNNALKLNGTIWMNDTISVRKSSNNYRGGNYRGDSRYGNDRYVPRSRSRERDRFHSDRHRERDYDRDRDRDRGERGERERHGSKHSKTKSIEVGGCIQKENGKIIIERKYQLNEVCTLFNGVTGCYSRDCDKIHVCSLCEDETHSLPKCVRSNTKIGEILMRQLQKENSKPGAAMTRIELNEKVKDKKRPLASAAGTNSDSMPPKKKLKVSAQSLRPKRITELVNVTVNYLLFLLDGSVWRRARVVERDGDIVKVHYLGWDNKYDERLSVHTARHRLSVNKPEKFYSEATINKTVKQKLTGVKSTQNVKDLDIELVKTHLKLCQLKNDGPVDLLQERLLNVTDEIRLLDCNKASEVIDINMRKIDELFAAGESQSQCKKESENGNGNDASDVAVRVLDQCKDENAQKGQQKLQQLCRNYNSPSGCNDAKCELTHECELCGSELHITIDCANNNL